MSVVFVDRSSIHYESLGRGRPVVFLHSWIGTWRYWVPSMQLTAVSHSAYAVDLLGFGDTAGSPAECSLDCQARMVLGFLDEMGMDRIAVVGHGLGALVGLLLASHNPGRVDRMVGVAIPLAPNAVKSSLQTADLAELARILAGPAATPEKLGAPSATVHPEALSVPLDSGLIDSALAAVRGASIPYLLIYGANDPLILPPSPEAAASLGPSIHRLVLEQSGHFPMLDGADIFHRLLIDFLALDPGASPHLIQPREEWRRRMR